MSFDVFLHHDVKKYLRRLEDDEEQRCYDRLKECLTAQPFNPRPKCDIKKLVGKRKTAYRLRVGDHRFRYVVTEDEVKVVEAFNRGRGYR